MSAHQNTGLYCYIGPGDGRGEIHKLIELKEGVVITWSIPTPDKTAPGWSLLGSVEMFKQFFKPLAPPAPVNPS